MCYVMKIIIFFCYIMWLFLDFCVNSLKEMDDITTCPICYEQFREPVMIPSCQHIFCLRCIAKAWMHQGIGCPDYVDCPCCRGRHFFRRGQADLPTSRITERLKGIKAGMKGCYTSIIVHIQFACVIVHCVSIYVPRRYGETVKKRLLLHPFVVLGSVVISSFFCVL